MKFAKAPHRSTRFARPKRPEPEAAWEVPATDEGIARRVGTTTSTVENVRAGKTSSVPPFQRVEIERLLAQQAKGSNDP